MFSAPPQFGCTINPVSSNQCWTCVPLLDVEIRGNIKKDRIYVPCLILLRKCVGNGLLGCVLMDQLGEFALISVNRFTKLTLER